jgi:hypothetical protein
MAEKRPELTTNLLPCPFCGSEPVLSNDRAFRALFSISCQNEHCLQPETQWSDLESCVQLWNLRYKPADDMVATGK